MIPSVAEERAMALARKYERFEPQLRTAWRSNGLFVSIVFSVLTLIAVAATFGFFHLLEMPKGFITAAIAIAVAELLIRRLRFFGTGVESALWLGGLFALIFGLPGEGRAEAILLFAAASFVAGARVRNAWFGALGLVLITAYFALRDLDAVALAFPLALTLMAVVALMREWQRPSTESFFSIAVVVMPAAGAIAGPRLEPGWALFWLVAAAALLVSGLRMRHHALLTASGVAVVIAAIAGRDVLPWPAEWQLIAAGALLMASAVLATRVLRGRERGIVIAPEAAGDSLEILATLQLSPTVETVPRQEGRGGSFGGAGASGEF
ncbi:MAG TPA: hypothetical protein VMS98_06025 [Thermoanaerobaculia bacterium]|nr:hypothetical protein [Thermoanaerobaculia bacterium]